MIMSFSPDSNLVQKTIDLNYANKKRAASMKWFFINVFFFLLFTYDLICIGNCPATWTGYIELMLASLSCLSALRHGVNLIPLETETPTQLSRQQLKLLGLTDADLDSSMVLSEKSALSAVEESESVEALSLSLSPERWRGAAEGGRASPPSAAPSPPRPPSPPNGPFAPLPEALSRDRFIADHHSLTHYLKEYETQQMQQGAEQGGERGGALAGCARAYSPPSYHLSTQDHLSENSKLEEGSPQGSPQVYWQLDIDPQKLTQWNLNLRLWIHITILERLVREMESVDVALGRLAGGEARLGQLGGERLRQLAALPALPALRDLLPFLEPFADQRYAVRRIRELARAPCLSAYRWNGGGADWDEAQPTDAELILHLLATYLDGQMTQSGNPRPFSAQYLHYSAAGGARPALGLQRVGRRPPQWALWLGGELCGVPRGRANLLHALLLLLAAAARQAPPALGRTHLGPAGLNMLWIIGR